MFGIAGVISHDPSQSPPSTIVSTLSAGIAARNGTAEIAELPQCHAVVVASHNACLSLQDHSDSCSLCDHILAVGDISLIRTTDLAEKLGCPADLPALHMLKHAWLRWGPDMPQHVEGHFAVVLIDQRKATTYCMRDRIGIKPFFYRNTADCFVFGSEPEMIDPLMSLRSDDTQLACYLAGVPAYREDVPGSDIKRLLPGHSLTVTANDVTSAQYWDYACDRVTYKDAAKAFRTRFFRSVEDLLPTDGKCGALLSGGLDSSAVALVTDRLGRPSRTDPIQTYSLTFPNDPETDERQYIDAVLGQGQFEPHFIPDPGNLIYNDPETLLTEQGGLVPSIGIGRLRHLHQSAAEDGVTVLFDGHGGDEVAGDGLRRLNELAKAGKWITLVPLVYRGAQRYGERPIEEYIRLYMAHSPKNSWRHWMAWRLVKTLYGSRPRRQPLWQQHVRPELIKAATDSYNNVADLRDEQVPDRTLDLEGQMRAFTSGILSQALEMFDRSAARAGVDMRYPFYDIDLIDLTLSVPSKEKLNRHGLRSLLRHAMADVYPAALRKRHSKSDFSANLARELAATAGAELRAITEQTGGPLERYIDTGALRPVVTRFLSAPETFSGSDTGFLWRVLMLHHWFEMGGRST